MTMAVLPGRAGQIRVIETAMPDAPRGDEVLLRMAHAPVNPADLLAIDGRYA